MLLIKNDKLIETFLMKCFLIILNSHVLHYITFN